MTGSGTLEGRVAIVTGGARGIGAAISSLLVARGASVVAADNGTSIDGRDGDPSVARDFADRLGARAVAYVEDMARAEAAAAAVDLAREAFGGIDIVINNAAILRDVLVFGGTPADWDSRDREQPVGRLLPGRGGECRDARPGQGRARDRRGL